MSAFNLNDILNNSTKTAAVPVSRPSRARGLKLRMRSVSELEFWKTGAEIRAALARYLMNDNHVPKRWRYIFAIPGIDLARKLMDEITAANTIYPTTEAEVEQRRAHQNEAVIACEQIIQHLQWLVDTLPVTVSSLDTVVELVNKEVALLKAWRKKNKALTPRRG